MELLRFPARSARLLPAPDPAAANCRMTVFHIRQDAPTGVLLLHTLTRALVLLTPEEAASLPAPAGELRQALIRLRFLVPEGLDEHAMALELRQTLRLMAGEPDALDKFTVFTTTGCNARCFYCFESGWDVRSMTAETARAAADFMLRSSRGRPFHIDWFGGEPLCNTAAMDEICRRLEAGGASFYSNMTTNGYLLTPALLEKARTLWRLRAVSITLDGREAAYNRVKNYIYPGVNAYRQVTENIRAAAEAGLRVSLRLNFDDHSAGEITALVEELCARFGGVENISVNPAMLFEDPNDPASFRSQAQRTAMCQTLERLYDRLERAGLCQIPPLAAGLPLHQCMADSGSAVTILPDGHLGLCEHYLTSDFLGDVWDGSMDETLLAKYREPQAEIPECRTCPLLPTCLRIRKCPTRICYPQLRDLQIRRTQKAMLAAAGLRRGED